MRPTTELFLSIAFLMQGIPFCVGLICTGIKQVIRNQDK